MPSISLHQAISPVFTRLSPYERHLSALGMIGGFATDYYFYGRIDHLHTQAIFLFYIVMAAVSIGALHVVEARVQRGEEQPRWRWALPVATQFALGSLWSAFLVFYSRSAVMANAWPFIAVLAAILIANELIRTKRSRLVLSNVLFFFALFSYAIFLVPIYTGTIDKATFLMSGAVAAAGFVTFQLCLAFLGPERFRQVWYKIGLGALAVFALLNGFYFANILPPLPLALTDAGAYYSVKKVGDVYDALGEQRSWYSKFGFPTALHVVPDEPVYVYSAVFAPIQLSTQIVHRWQHYDAAAKRWVIASTVVFGINGGRDGGYRGYTIKSKPAAGDWRVDIDTMDGRRIGRVAFTVDYVPKMDARIAETLK